jgi:hypothetical protein
MALILPERIEQAAYERALAPGVVASDLPMDVFTLVGPYLTRSERRRMLCLSRTFEKWCLAHWHTSWLPLCEDASESLGLLVAWPASAPPPVVREPIVFSTYVPRVIGSAIYTADYIKSVRLQLPEGLTSARDGPRIVAAIPYICEARDWETKVRVSARSTRLNQLQLDAFVDPSAHSVFRVVAAKWTRLVPETAKLCVNWNKTPTLAEFAVQWLTADRVKRGEPPSVEDFAFYVLKLGLCIDVRSVTRDMLAVDHAGMPNKAGHRRAILQSPVAELLSCYHGEQIHRRADAMVAANAPAHFPRPQAAAAAVAAPLPLSLDLHAYQRDAATWMLSVDAMTRQRLPLARCALDTVPVTIASHAPFVARYTPSGKRGKDIVLAFAGFEWTPAAAAEVAELSSRGGFLADETGMGKTRTASAVIAAHALANRSRSDASGVTWDVDSPDLYTPLASSLRAERRALHERPLLATRAALVVCPRALVSTWQDELCAVAPTLQVLTLVTVHSHWEITYADVAAADVVLVTSSFLENRSGYVKRLYAGHTGLADADDDDDDARQLPTVKDALEDLATGACLARRRTLHDTMTPAKVAAQRAPLLDVFAWQGIYVDEADQLVANGWVYVVLARLAARSVWLLTATPFHPAVRDKLFDSEAPASVLQRNLMSGRLFHGLLGAHWRGILREHSLLTTGGGALARPAPPERDWVQPWLVHEENAALAALLWCNRKREVARDHYVPPPVERVYLIDPTPLERALEAHATPTRADLTLLYSGALPAYKMALVTEEVNVPRILELRARDNTPVPRDRVDHCLFYWTFPVSGGRAETYYYLPVSAYRAQVACATVSDAVDAWQQTLWHAHLTMGHADERLNEAPLPVRWPLWDVIRGDLPMHFTFLSRQQLLYQHWSALADVASTAPAERTLPGSSKLRAVVNYMRHVWALDPTTVVAVASGHALVMEAVLALVKAEALSYVYIGKQSARQLQAQFKLLNAPESAVRVIVLDTRYQSTGIDLKRASHIVLLDAAMAETASALADVTDVQTIGRLARLTQQHQVHVVRFAWRDSEDAKRHAKRLPADAVLSAPPPFHAPAVEEPDAVFYNDYFY